MAAADADAWAADIICSLRGADLAGWTPPWRNPATPPMPPAADDGGDARGLVWPAVARGKRSRRGSSPSASGSAASAGAAKKQRNKQKKKERRARGSPASPLDYSAVSGSGSAASTSGGEDGAFCSPPAAIAATAATAAAAAPDPDKVGLAGRRSSVLPVPPPRPAGQRPRKKMCWPKFGLTLLMRLPEIQQMVRSLSVENDALRQEMKALQKACTALSKENGKLERPWRSLKHSYCPSDGLSNSNLALLKPERSEHPNEEAVVPIIYAHCTKLDKRHENSSVEENKGKPQPDQRAAEQEAQNGFVLPDLNLPVDMADGSAD
ncbi:hypothetical protein ACP4OV_013494 [Aristida adscensionis]